MVNQTILQGRLCANPELRETQSGVKVCSFRVAWSEKYKEKETKLFLSCTAWRSTGEFVHKYFSKGQEIAVEGKLSTREWEDKEGNKRSTVELAVDKAHFCGSKRDGTNGGGDGNYADPVSSGVPVSAGFEPLDENDEELPF